MKIMDADIVSWYYKPKAGTVSGYWSSSNGGLAIPLYQSGTSLESVNVDANCLKVTGSVAGATVTLAGKKGSFSSGSGSAAATIAWESGEVWTRLTPPTQLELEETMRGSLGLSQSTSGPLLQVPSPAFAFPDSPGFVSPP